MDILKLHKDLIKSYRTYIESFIHIKDQRIKEFVKKEIDSGKLWPEPLVQFNPRFETGAKLEDIGLHPNLTKLLPSRSLYKHQEEAIKLGTTGRGFVVTSGTGSGKSLTFLATIFNDILVNNLSDKKQVHAVIVYPMNALINSQSDEIREYELNYLSQFGSVDESKKTLEEKVLDLRKRTGKAFPIRYAQFTGQESQTIRDDIRDNPPHVLLTNYMMLELLMTRGGDDASLRDQILSNIKFLVFDELHTYRGRLGSDLALLIRRIKSGADKEVLTLGTSATMVSGNETSLISQRQEVANFATKIFGTEYKEDQVITETIVKGLSNKSITSESLRKYVPGPINMSGSRSDLYEADSALWIENNIALENKDGKLVRRKPQTIQEIAKELAKFTILDVEIAEKHILELLTWANHVNTTSDPKEGKLLPFRLHQFVAQTGTVYATLEKPFDRAIRLEAAIYETSDKLLYPLLFSRESGHEFYSVRLQESGKRIQPREIFAQSDVEEDENGGSTNDGYVIFEHEDDQKFWDEETIESYIPDAWLTNPDKSGRQKLKPANKRSCPIRISFDSSGNYELGENLPFKGWFIKAPLKVDPTSKTIYGNSGDYTKLAKLGGEGRSTATTIFSYEVVRLLTEHNQQNRSLNKLLSFTDNRQDASLQSGHFNDFIKVGLLRSAINSALQKQNTLDYSTIGPQVVDALNLNYSEYHKTVNEDSFSGPKAEAEELFGKYILYRSLYDLRRSWRVIMPNLEQCGLLEINYKHLDESCEPRSWSSIPELTKLSREEIKGILIQVLDYFRRSYAIYDELLQKTNILANQTKIKSELKHPWSLDSDENLEEPAFIRVEKLGDKDARSYRLASAGQTSAFGIYIKSKFDIKGETNYRDFVYKLFSVMKNAGWLKDKEAKNEAGEVVLIYQLKLSTIVWSKIDKDIIRKDDIRNRTFGNHDVPVANSYFKQFYQSGIGKLKQISAREHTGQIGDEERKERENNFRDGSLKVLYCSPTMELGVNISDLSVVHMRNVPPSPSNYAQRSGRAGRSGQAALVVTYCSNYSAHDKHYFSNSKDMVAGQVAAPKIDLVNEELLQTHLYACVLLVKPLDRLRNSFTDIIDIENKGLPFKEGVEELLVLTDYEKAKVIGLFNKVINESHLGSELAKKSPHWYSENWIKIQLDAYKVNFEKAMSRWRALYKQADLQQTTNNQIINNHVYEESNQIVKDARAARAGAEKQQDILKNQEGQSKKSGATKVRSQSEFYPYRYLAAEGFLPGYNFTRLPIRVFLEGNDQSGEFLSRPRKLALSEFGPQNTLYHNGTKYRIDKIIKLEQDLNVEKAKVSKATGYIMSERAGQFNYNLDPITDAELTGSNAPDYLPNLLEFTESRGIKVERITCAEEERVKRGYELKTYFYLENLAAASKARILDQGEELLKVHHFPSARLVHVNKKWKKGDDGFTINKKTGMWQRPKVDGTLEDYISVMPFTTQTANALFIEPMAALALREDGVITLMYALKRAIELYFQVESNEIGAEIMGEGASPNIMLYESAEGSLGILEQIVDKPEVYKALMAETYKLCFLDMHGKEIDDNDLVPATYADLLSYYNQPYHLKIDRRLIRGPLARLRDTQIEHLTNVKFRNYEEQYQYLMTKKDPNSSTETEFLKYLYEHNLRLPDGAQNFADGVFTQPDFFYEPNVHVFCDGTPHDKPDIQANDRNKRTALRNSGQQVLVWHYATPLKEFVSKRPDIFKPVK